MGDYNLPEQAPPFAQEARPLRHCFGCALGFGRKRLEASCPEAGTAPECIDCLREKLGQTPLEILAGTLLHFDHLDDTARKILNAYDGFLAILADEDKRRRLETVESEHYESDEVFQEARRLSHGYRDGLLELFFDQKSGLFDLTRNYGVF